MAASAAPVGSRARSRARMAGAVTANQPRVGQLELENIALDPDPVAPDGTLDVVTQIANHALFISPTDPDRCNPVGTNEAGLEVTVVINAEWGETAETVHCIGGPTFSNVNRKEVRTTLTDVPSSPGDYSLSVQLRLAASGQESTTQGETVAVREDARDEPGCDADADCPGEEVCRNGRCVSPPPNGGGGIVEFIRELFGDVQTGALVLVVLFIVLQSVAPG